MSRLLFEKTGNAVWISHLDLMRVFQRSFQRAGLPLKHTQGFNPRPSVSIALPLSVGIESKCELLDFELEGCDASCEEIALQLNNHLISGIIVRDVYDQGRKIRDLALVKCVILLEYDSGVPGRATGAISNLFSQTSLIVPKKTKNGMQDQDIIPMIRRLQVSQSDERTLQLEALICCQNPTLNPMQLQSAIEKYLPDLKPDFCRCGRLEVYDVNEEIFR